MAATPGYSFETGLHSVERALAGLDSALVALSGGVDSSLLIALAARTLGAERVLAVTAVGPLTSVTDERCARQVASVAGVAHRVVAFDPLQIPGFAANPPERCYLCKQRLLALLDDIRVAEGLAVILDGTIADDAEARRPGGRAVAEAGAIRPLADAGFTKEDVRQASHMLGLPTADRPSSPCLASRFPYETPITKEALMTVERAERALHERGFPVVRVRHHGHTARIEVPGEQIARLASEPLRADVTATLRDLGYAYVAVDLMGFRSGSLDEVLPDR
jgi:uncharacterized protein